MAYTPEELAAFSAKLNQDSRDDFVRGPAAPLPAAPPAELGFGDRLQQSGMRLAQNPAVQGVFGLPAYAATKALGLDRARDTTSFTRENPQPDVVQLKPMAPLELQVPTSPTLAQQQARSAGGGGGGGGGFGQLARDYRQAQLNEFGTFNDEKDLRERGGELAGERIDKMAGLQEIEAARKQRDAEVMAQHQAQVQAKHDAFLQRNQQLSDEIGAQRIDPSRVMGDKSLGEKMSLLIGGLLSGANGQGPQALARIDNMISEGVKAQMANVDNMKAQLGARQNLFGQMMAESGDRRTAEAQTRALMYESVKQKLGADAERLGIPEVQNNAQLLMNGITQQKINPLQVQMTGSALQAAQQQAAAAAAAQRAAEEKAWNRSMQVADLALKKDAQDIERGKLDKGDKDKTEEEVQKLASGLSDPKLAAGRSALENEKRRLGLATDGTVILDKDGKPAVDQSQGIPGVGPAADLRDKAFAKPTGVGVINPAGWAAHAIGGLSDQEKVGRSDWEKLRLAYQVQVTGSGGSEAQMKQIQQAFAGKESPAEQRAAIAEADAVFRQIESRQKAGVSPAALKTYEARLNNLDPTLPSTVRIKP